jgi:NADPH-dependent 2,4-dienoyl-CoA reductase/sulfur reductase-like enzyme
MDILQIEGSIFFGVDLAKRLALFTARRTAEDKILKVVIVGAGEVGFHIARRLAIENRDVVLVDKDSEALRRVSDHIDVQAVTARVAAR